MDGGGKSKRGPDGPDAALGAVAHAPILLHGGRIEAPGWADFVAGGGASLLGYEPGELEGAAFGRLLGGDDDLRRLSEAVARLAKAGSAVVELQLKRKGGGLVWYRDTLCLAEGEDDRFTGCLVDISNERAFEAEMTEATAMISAIVGSAMDAVITIDEWGEVIEFNPAAERMFGYARADVIGHRLSDLILPERFVEHHEAGLTRFREHGRSRLSNRRLQIDARRADGSEFQAELTIASAVLGDRRIFIGDIRDISERIEAEAERKRLTRMVTEAIDSVPIGFCISAADGTIELCNTSFASLYGLHPRDMVGMTRIETIRMLAARLVSVDGARFEVSEADLKRITHLLTHAEAEPVELELATGEWMAVWSTRLSGSRIATVRTNITAIKRAEIAMRESMAMIRSAVEACQVPIGMTRASDSRVLYESPAAKDLFGRGHLAGPVYAITGFVDPADRDRELEILRRTGRLDGFEVRMRGAGGREFWASISARLIEYQGEDVIVSSVYDLTERRQIEEEMARHREAIHQNEKLAAMGELLAGVAHELNNPLSIVLGQAMLLQESTSDPRVADRATRITEAADRCSRIVKTFLAMARRRPKRSEPVALNDVVRAAADMTAYAFRSSQVELSLALAPGLPAVTGDADQLAQLIANLMFNAEQALRGQPEPRRVEVATAENESAGEIVVTVRDTGPGIPPELQKRVFEPFFTTKEVGAGTGIGLSLCYRIVQAHSGRIALASAPGEGTLFTIHLPAAEDVAAADPVAASQPAAIDGGRILVVDDEPGVAEVVVAALRSDGHSVETAADGKRALELLVRGSFDVVLSDLKMAGLDGRSLFAEVERTLPAMAARMAFITGDTMSDEAQAFLRAAGRPYLEKPITPQDVRRLVRAMLRS